MSVLLKKSLCERLSTVGIMGRSKSHKSPATTRRSYRRLISFLIKTKPLKPILSISCTRSINFQPLKPVMTCVSQPSISIPSMVKPKLLSFNQMKQVDVPPVKHPELVLTSTSSTCDTPECKMRRRPCFGVYPQDQYFLVDGELL